MESATGLGQPWDTILTVFGPSGFLLTLALFTVVRGDWIPKKSHESVIELLKSHHAEQMKTVTEAYTAQITRLELANQEWRNIAIHGLDAAEEATLVGKELVKGTRK